MSLPSRAAHLQQLHRAGQLSAAAAQELVAAGTDAAQLALSELLPDAPELRALASASNEVVLDHSRVLTEPTLIHTPDCASLEQTSVRVSAPSLRAGLARALVLAPAELHLCLDPHRELRSWLTTPISRPGLPPLVSAGFAAAGPLNAALTRAGCLTWALLDLVRDGLERSGPDPYREAASRPLWAAFCERVGDLSLDEMLSLRTPLAHLESNRTSERDLHAVLTSILTRGCSGSRTAREAALSERALVRLPSYLADSLTARTLEAFSQASARAHDELAVICELELADDFTRAWGLPALDLPDGLPASTLSGLATLGLELVQASGASARPEGGARAQAALDAALAALLVRP